VATEQPSDALRQLRRVALLRDCSGLSDEQLLHCFVGHRDDAAFEALVRRHGPMVLAVCRRVLGNAHDAEDAFQATFLVLVRKAASIRQGALQQTPPAQDLATIFQQSRDHGLAPASLDHIAREWAPRLGTSEADVRSYLTENIYYQLDEPCLEGLQLFYRYAAEIGALPAAPEMRFLVPSSLVPSNPVPAL